MPSEVTIWGAAAFVLIASFSMAKWLLNHHMSEKKTWDLEREKRLDTRFLSLESDMKDTRSSSGKLREDMHALDKRIIQESSSHKEFRESMEAFKTSMSEAIKTSQALIGFLGTEPDGERVVQISPTHWVVMKPRKPSKPK